MKKFKNLPVRAKLLLSHCLIVVLALIVAGVGIYGMVLSTNRMDRMQNIIVASTDAAGEIMYATADLQRVTAAMIADPQHMTNQMQAMTDDVTMMGTALQLVYTRLSEHPDAHLHPDAFAMIEEIGALVTVSGDQRQEVLDLLVAGKIAEAEASYKENYGQSLLQIQNMATQLKDKVEVITIEDYEYCIWFNYVLAGILIGFTVVALVFGLISAFTVSRNIRNPIKQLVDASLQMQQGNLAVADDITYESKDEIGVLAASMRDTMRLLNTYVDEIGQTMRTVAGGNLMIRDNEITDFRGDFAVIKESISYILDNLNSTLSDIQIASEQVNAGADQVASGAQALSQGATEQAAAVQELAATLGEINGKVQQTGEKAIEARENTAEELNMMSACDAQMKDMITAMEEISRTSEEIGKINKTIDDIAFQTNILALNAAVEAARAGAAGKGFAVVADEVRSLAAKSAEAAKNASALIEASIAAVQKGVQIAGDTAENLQKVSESAGKNAEMVTAIAGAAEGLMSSIEQVATGIDQISAVVQTNSATAEESAAASEELSSQAAMLKDLTNQFHLR